MTQHESEPSASETQPTAGQRDIPTYVAPSLLATMFCCFPLGLVALTYAVRASTRLAAGDLAAAEQASHSARRWLFVALGGFVALTLLIILVQVAANLANP